MTFLKRWNNMNDTPSSVQKQRARMFESRTPAQRLRMASSMFDAGKKLMRAGIENAAGSLTTGQIRARMFMRMYSGCFTHDELVRIVQRLPNMQLE
jgi:hypothetical protein